MPALRCDSNIWCPDFIFEFRAWAAVSPSCSSICGQIARQYRGALCYQLTCNKYYSKILVNTVACIMWSMSHLLWWTLWHQVYTVKCPVYFFLGVQWILNTKLTKTWSGGNITLRLLFQVVETECYMRVYICNV